MGVSVHVSPSASGLVASAVHGDRPAGDGLRVLGVDRGTDLEADEPERAAQPALAVGPAPAG